MELPLAYYGNPILRKKAEQVLEITEEIKTLVNDMIDTIYAQYGLGLAAPQVHHSIALFVICPIVEIDGKPVYGEVRVFINPKIISYSEEEWLRDEGCLSIPKIFGAVPRPLHITVRYTNLEGREVEESFSDMEARIIMHENDHINGILFIDRIHGKERKKMDLALNEIKKKYKHH